jgi:hypothetical protein
VVLVSGTHFIYPLLSSKMAAGAACGWAGRARARAGGGGVVSYCLKIKGHICTSKVKGGGGGILGGLKRRDVQGRGGSDRISGLGGCWFLMATLFNLLLQYRTRTSTTVWVPQATSNPPSLPPLLLAVPP